MTGSIAERRFRSCLRVLVIDVIREPQIKTFDRFYKRPTISRVGIAGRPFLGMKNAPKNFSSLCLAFFKHEHRNSGGQDCLLLKF